MLIWNLLHFVSVCNLPLDIGQFVFRQFWLGYHLPSRKTWLKLTSKKWKLCGPTCFMLANCHQNVEYICIYRLLYTVLCWQIVCMSLQRLMYIQVCMLQQFRTGIWYRSPCITKIGWVPVLIKSDQYGEVVTYVCACK
jgi:hypothetical protein